MALFLFSLLFRHMNLTNLVVIIVFHTVISTDLASQFLTMM